MNQTLLEILRCPLCAREFRLSARVRETSGEISAGVLSCGHHRFPIVAGIPVLQADARISSLVPLVESGRPDRALLRLIRPGGARRPSQGRSRPRFLTRLLGFGPLQRAVARRRLARLLSADGGHATFAHVIHEVNPRGAAYFTYRFSDPTFLTGLAMASLMRPDQMILDVGCGAGHLAYAASRWLGLRPIVGADRSFRMLYLARRFLVPGGDFVCCEAESRLPFHDGAFTYVFSSDALHYMEAKSVATAELARVVARDGAIILAHLHNRRATNPSPGWPLTPEEYAGFFPGMQVAILRDSVVLDSFLGHRSIDLTNRDDPGAIENEPSISLIASYDGPILSTYHAQDLHIPKDRLRINPLYHARDLGAELHLRLQFPSPRYEAEFGEIRKYLPEEVAIPKRYLSDRASPEAASHLAALVKSWVLVDLPDRYA